MKAAVDGVVPLEKLGPSPTLEPREVISSVMAALHRSNWDSPTPFYGFEVALRFLAPTHQAKQKKAKPAGFSRFMRQPHKVGQISWNEYRFEGPVIELKGAGADGCDEVYQMCSMRASPSEEWMSTRWKLVLSVSDFGEYVSQPQWLVEAVFANEPDTQEDVEFLRSKQPGAGSEAREADEPRVVVDRVMHALRRMDEPYPLHGAAMATRYCSPRNRASELNPEVFARYLEDPWYSILVEWDEKAEDDDDEGDETGCATDTRRCTKEVDVLVRRDGEDSYTMVSWELSQYDGNWLIDSLNII
uniref:Uncharacterized protein n=1 Tax=Prymnesium polylepis TaxID=72548 RepID=A0A7S4MXM5_9EUKA